MDIQATVKWRLGQLGYLVADDDDQAIAYVISKAQSALLEELNLPELLPALEYTLVDMAAAKFLAEKKASGQLEGYDFAELVKSISEGDTSVTYANDAGGAEKQFDALLASLARPPAGVIAKYRRVAW